MAEIRLLNVCRTLTAEQATAVTDAFTSIGGNWTDAGTWSLDGVTTSGIITASNGKATTGALNALYTARYASQSLSTLRRREVTLDAPVVPDDGELSILMDMDVTTPVPAASVRFRVVSGVTTNGVEFWDLKLYTNEVLRTSKRIYTKSSPSSVGLAIDTTNTARCYVNGNEQLNFAMGGYIAAGGRVGIGLKSSTTLHTTVEAFTLRYTVQGGAISVSEIPSRMLVASAGGFIYVQDKSGDMQVVSSARTLASDRLLQSTNRLQKLYIADYGLRKYGQGTGSINGSNVLTDAGVSSWSDLGTDTDDDRLEIISGTGTTPGVYAIFGISAGNLTATGAATGSSLYYRVLRGPKIFNSGDLTLTLFPIGTIGNQVPVGCTIVALGGDRLYWSGDPLNPHRVYASKAGDVENYAYVSTLAAVEPGGAFVLDPTITAGIPGLGDSVTAVIPHVNDYVVFAGYRSITILRGDPTIGGRLDLMSRDIGIIDKFAYCYTPEQALLGLSADGLYLFPQTPNGIPERVSRSLLPLELLEINTILYDVQLNYDVKYQGVNIFVTPKTAGATKHWWFDWGAKSFWRETYVSNHDPTASCVHTVDDNNSPTTMLGCRDGYIRRFITTLGYDDDQVMPSECYLGPFGAPHVEFILHEILMEMATMGGRNEVYVLPGDTPEKAASAEPVFTFSIGGGGDSFAPAPQLCRVRGGAFYIKIINQTNSPWALESLRLNIEHVSRRRLNN